ncbi:hypothetical protein CC80DRAFT_472913 [Byssothecium circinans]|uniref:Uncharacterized protein n=1 Tax=Byssothecium circinans TaxID=147558 RepID=A0A6A5TWV5_9PLEO|nr:hypothetical protein CC80DRAFT_472913 [Byssothecium circinans]
MSFGVGVGDIITTVRLASEVRKSFAAAPAQYADIRQHTRTLSYLLLDLEEILPYCDFTNNRKLQVMHERSAKIPEDIDVKLSKYTSLESQAEGKRDALLKAWKKIMWDKKEIEEYRDRLKASVGEFTAMLQNVNIAAMFEVKVGVERLNQREDDREQSKKREQILDWFSTIDHASQQQDVLIRRQAGTGTWLLESDEFVQWFDLAGSTMVCPGMAGAGKTVVSAIAVDHLQQRFQNDANVGLAYLYFNYKNGQEHTHETVLRSLLRQLLGNDEVLIPEASTLYEQKKNARPSTTELHTVLKATILKFSRVFIVLDALDENYASDAARLKRLVQDLLRLQQSCKFSLLATTRDISDITLLFEGCIRKDIRAHEEDVKAYIESRMVELYKGLLSKYPEIENLVRSEVPKATDGMFLLARLHMDSLKDHRTIAKLRDALKNLPKGDNEVNDAYDLAMERIDTQGEGARDLARNILMWVVHAKRPLSVRELQDALAIEPGTSSLDEERRPEPEDLDSLCAGLITVDQNSQIVRLVHYTTLEYFHKRDHFPDAEAHITKASLAYLSFTEVDKVLQGLHVIGGLQYKAWIEAMDHFGLLSYVILEWGCHASGSEETDDIVLDFLMEPGGRLWSHPKHWEWRYIPGVHLAAHFGLSRILRRLILIEDVQLGMEHLKRPPESPLFYAVRNNQVRAVKCLLNECLVGPNERFHTWSTRAIGVAIDLDRFEIIDEILNCEKSQTTFRTPTRGFTPLMRAASKKDVRMTQFVVDALHRNRLFDVHREGILPGVPENITHFQVANIMFDKETVELRQNPECKTALRVAAKMSDEETVQLLLKYEDFKSDVSRLNVSKAATIAAERGHFPIFQLLFPHYGYTLQHGLRNGHTLLAWAAKGGCCQTIELLLARYRDLHLQIDTNEAETALTWAVQSNNPGAVDLVFTSTFPGPDLHPSLDHCFELACLALKVETAKYEVFDHLISKYKINFQFEERHYNQLFRIVATHQRGRISRISTRPERELIARLMVEWRAVPDESTIEEVDRLAAGERYHRDHPNFFLAFQEELLRLYEMVLEKNAPNRKVMAMKETESDVSPSI